MSSKQADPVPRPVGPDPADSVEAAADPKAAIDRVVGNLVAGTDREANFRALYDSYYSPLVKFFANKGCSPEDCLDLTQETFFGIYKGLRGYHHEGHFASWMFRIATTTYLKRVRARTTAKRQGREVPYEELESDQAMADSEGEQLDTVLRQERRQAMRQAVGELPEQMRKCLTLRLYHDLAYREIAVVMKLKIDTVKAHLFQARKRLQDQLGKGSLESLDRRIEDRS